jgi:hypothetical protein
VLCAGEQLLLLVLLVLLLVVVLLQVLVWEAGQQATEGLFHSSCRLVVRWHSAHQQAQKPP